MGNPYAPPRPDAPPRPEPDDAPSGPQHGGPGSSVPPGPRAPGPQEPGPRAPGPQVTGPQPGDGGPAGGSPERPPVDPEVARAASRRVLHFGLLLLVVIVVSTMPFPWRGAALVAAVGSVVVGVRALIAVRRARVRGMLVPALAIGIGLALTIILQALGSLAMWDVETAYQECVDGAITVSATDRCDAERQQAIEDWTERLGRAPATDAP
ncbi:hypothetical protein IF650_11890 [Cellulosimicrobium terreum]|nr:hypothetical protein [Cellulosimicrobium terreum]